MPIVVPVDYFEWLTGTIMFDFFFFSNALNITKFQLLLNVWYMVWCTIGVYYVIYMAVTYILWYILFCAYCCACRLLWVIVRHNNVWFLFSNALNVTKLYNYGVVHHWCTLCDIYGSNIYLVIYTLKKNEIIRTFNQRSQAFFQHMCWVSYLVS